MNAQLISLISLALNLLLGGGGLAIFLRYKIQSSGEKRVDFSTVLAEVKGQRDEAWEHIDKQDIRIANMEAEIQGLRLARDLDPFPNWISDLQGHCIYVNREFERIFLEPRGESYRFAIGKTRAELGWSDSFERTLISLDAAARSRPDGTARATTSLDVPGLGPSSVTVHKFPIRFRPSGVIVAYAGFITDIVPEGGVVGPRTPALTSGQTRQRNRGSAPDR